jgi:CHAT domain-containing protein
MAAATLEAERGYTEFRGVSHEWAWQFAVLRATILSWRGMKAGALNVLASEPGPPTSGELAVKKLRLEGGAYTSLRKFSDAKRKLDEAEDICRASVFPACGEVVNSQGRLEMERGHYLKAQGQFERALAFARAGNDRFLEATALLNLSHSADEQTHFDEALNWADLARQICIPLGFADIAQTALGNMGWAYYKLGDPERAKGLLADAKKQAQDLGDVVGEVGWLTTAGYVYMDSHDFKLAEESFQQSLALARQLNSKGDVVNALSALAFVSEQTNKLDEAKGYADDALAMARADGNGRDIVYPVLVEGRIAAQQRDYSSAEASFRDVAQSKDAPVFLKWEAERSLAKLYEDQQQSDLADREFQAALSTFETARSELQHEDSRLPFLSNASRIYDDYIHFLVSRGKTAEALQVADYGRGRTLAEGLGLLPKGTSFKPDQLNAPATARRTGGTILFYWVGEKQSYLWAITPKKIALFSLPGAPEIDAVTQRYRRALIGPQDVLETVNADGSSLYNTLLAPAEELLANSPRIFIIPDGPLNSLNFETILVPKPKLHYWIEEATIANANSLKLLDAASRVPASRRPRNLLLFGDAVAPNLDYPELSKAAVEMQSIEKHFPAAQQQVFTREQANPASYLSSKPERFSYIHFVAHGTASRLSPLDSAIVLSKATVQEDSFKLYARDIIQHPLRADLVTISTCYGAGSRAYSGEGMVGLSWAFLRAGAHNVIGALWEASDASTPVLMDAFYQELGKGKSPEAALRTAKLSLLGSGSAFRRPFYWAPFQLFTGS